MTGILNSVETFTVYPTNKYNRPPRSSTIALHGLDLISPAVHIRNHRFFHRPPSHLINTTTDLVGNLRSSLAEALELYPPAAGTVLANDLGELYVSMDAKDVPGTPFFVEMKDTPYAGDTDDLSPRTVMLLPLSSSVLAVKVTRVM
jgi:hypothetical protein